MAIDHSEVLSLEILRNWSLRKAPKVSRTRARARIRVLSRFRGPKKGLEKRLERTGFGPLVDGRKVKDHNWYSVGFESRKSDRRDAQNTETSGIWTPGKGPKVSRTRARARVRSCQGVWRSRSKTPKTPTEIFLDIYIYIYIYTSVVLSL